MRGICHLGILVAVIPTLKSSCLVGWPIWSNGIKSPFLNRFGRNLAWMFHIAFFLASSLAWLISWLVACLQREKWAKISAWMFQIAFFLSFFVACLLASLKRKKTRKKTTFLWLFFQRRQLPLLV